MSIDLLIREMEYHFHKDSLKITHIKIKEKVTKKLTKNDKNIECPITYDIIRNGKEYHSCDCCNYNFSKKVMSEYIMKKNKCPMCVQNWTNTQVYINKNKVKIRLKYDENNNLIVKNKNIKEKKYSKIIKNNNKINKQYSGKTCVNKTYRK